MGVTVPFAARRSGVGVDLPAAGDAAGDRTIEGLYYEVFPQLAAYCWSLVRDRGHAEDLAQEAFARLSSRWISVRDPKPYLFHVATNLARNAWRRGAMELQVNARHAASERGVTDVDPSAALTVKQAVERLPRKLREAVLLYYYADLSVEEVAAAVHRPVGTVKRHLSEARKLLATALEDDDA